jgi:predicted dehydrogenase
MQKMNRRDFLDRSKKTTVGLGLGMTVLSSAASVHGAPANEKVTLGFIGTGGRGRHLLAGFLERDDIHVGALCDPRTDRLDDAMRIAAESQSEKPQRTIHYNEVLENPKVDAVINATPDHWHAPMTVWACQAGKDVYTEKPASHSAWEGEKMVQAARKYRRVVQLGTQNRSAPYNLEAKKYIDDGKLGEIHLCRVYNQKNWGNFTLGEPTEPPETLDWDLWNGPAPEKPYRSGYLNRWHHLWDYSSGDIINDGIHQIDLARWLIGRDRPKQVYCTGGRFHSEGDAQTPDTQIATFDFDDLLMTFELTLYTPYMYKTDMELRQSDMIPYWPQNATRIEIFGSKGLMFMGRHGGGWEVYTNPKSRKPVCIERVYGRFPDPEHKENFISCVRSRETPSADIEKGHLSTLLCHYATMSYRLGGEKLPVDPEDGTVDHAEAMKYYKRTYRAPYVIEEEV